MITKPCSWKRPFVCAAVAAVFAMASMSTVAAKKEEPAARYPNATRTAPKSDSFQRH